MRRLWRILDKIVPRSYVIHVYGMGFSDGYAAGEIHGRIVARFELENRERG